MRRPKKQAVQRTSKRMPVKRQDEDSKPIGKTDGARGSQQRGAGMKRGRGGD